MSKSSTQVNNASYTVNAPIDKIVLQNVQDPDGFAKALYENFSLVMAQQFSKFKFQLIGGGDSCHLIYIGGKNHG